MPQRSKVFQFPVEVKAYLDQELIKREFSGYIDLADTINELLSDKGYELSISKSAIGRYADNIKNEQSRIRATVEAAKALNTVVGDDADAMGQSLVALTQQKLFDILLALEEVEADPVSIKKMNVLALAVSRIARASVHQKKWDIEVREKAKLDAADAVEQGAVEKGLDAETAEFLRKKVLGIA